jgi:dTDP-4-dehydrorhamnose 3,5-epimerase
MIYSLMRKEVREIPGIQLLTAKCIPDERGYMLRSYTRSELQERGIPSDFPQALQSKSRRGVVRGLHFQWDPPQGKLVRCAAGSVLDVVVDVRHGSPTLGDHAAVELTAENCAVLWVPPGFAHGFMALEDDSTVFYHCTAEWAPQAEGGILWNDPDLAIDWPPLPPVLSRKDRECQTLSQWLADPLSVAFKI